MAGAEAALPALRVLPGPGAVSAAAALFPSIAHRMNHVVHEIGADWRRLGGDGVLETPETARVLAATRVPEAIADLVAARAAGTRAALDAYADALGALARRAAVLEPDIAAVGAAAASPSPSPGGGPDAAEVAARIRALNADAQQADEECARALRRVRQLTHLTGAGALLAFHEWEGKGGEVVIGLAEGTIERYRTLLVPEPGAPLPTIVEPEPLTVVETRFGTGFAESGSGLLLPETVVRSQQPLPDVDTTGMRERGVLTGAPEETGGMPGWAEGVSRGVGVAGVVVTVGATAVGQYQEDQQEHPEWSQGHDVADAGVAAATTGVGAAAGAWAGAELGAEGGAVLGTLICPGVGTVIGGIVGGAIGGFVGGGVGEKLGEGVHDLVSGIGSLF